MVAPLTLVLWTERSLPTSRSEHLHDPLRAHKPPGCYHFRFLASTLAVEYHRDQTGYHEGDQNYPEHVARHEQWPTVTPHSCLPSV